MDQNNEMLAQKALVFLLCVDMVRTALNNIGSTQTVDGSTVAIIAIDETIKAACSKAA